MNRSEHEAMELFQGPITGVRVKKIKESVDSFNDDLVAFVDKAMREGLKLMNEGIEDVPKAPKVFILYTLTKEH